VNHFLSKKIFSILALLFILSPLISFAQNNPGSSGYTGLQVECTGKALTAGGTEKECTFIDLIAQIKKIMDLAFLYSLPIMIIVTAYAGIKILLAAGNQSKITEAKNMAWKVGWGFFFILAAWLIVYAITLPLLNPAFNQFLKT